ncbi:hypothetical protein lerEdw1_020755, partial [Lerista edwardsae]
MEGIKVDYLQDKSPKLEEEFETLPGQSREAMSFPTEATAGDSESENEEELLGELPENVKWKVEEKFLNQDGSKRQEENLTENWRKESSTFQSGSFPEVQQTEE